MDSRQLEFNDIEKISKAIKIAIEECDIQQKIPYCSVLNVIKSDFLKLLNAYASNVLFNYELLLARLKIKGIRNLLTVHGLDESTYDLLLRDLESGAKNLKQLASEYQYSIGKIEALLDDNQEKKELTIDLFEIKHAEIIELRTAQQFDGAAKLIQKLKNKLTARLRMEDKEAMWMYGLLTFQHAVNLYAKNIKDKDFNQEMVFVGMYEAISILKKLGYSPQSHVNLADIYIELALIHETVYNNLELALSHYQKAHSYLSSINHDAVLEDVAETISSLMISTTTNIIRIYCIQGNNALDENDCLASMNYFKNAIMLLANNKSTHYLDHLIVLYQSYGLAYSSYIESFETSTNSQQLQESDLTNIIAISEESIQLLLHTKKLILEEEPSAIDALAEYQESENKMKVTLVKLLLVKIYRFVENNQLDDARTSLDQLKGLSPVLSINMNAVQIIQQNISYAYFHLGKTYCDQNDYPKAMLAFKKSFELISSLTIRVDQDHMKELRELLNLLEQKSLENPFALHRPNPKT